jgi:hypothetical protein
VGAGSAFNGRKVAGMWSKRAVSVGGGERREALDEGARLSRGGFLRNAGVAGLAVAGIGELVAAPLASAKTSRTVAPADRRRMYDNLVDVPSSQCSSYSTCNPCNGCCGSPCTPRGVAYCFYCSGSQCLGAGVYCFDHSPQTFRYCCN